MNLRNEQKIPWIAVGPELTAGYTLSFLSAASSMGYELNNAALNYEQKTVQFYWTISEQIKETDNNNLKECIKEYLIFKGESANYQELFTIFLIQSSYANKLPLSKKDIDNSIYSRIQKNYENILNDEKLIIKIDKDQLENGEFWLSNPPIVYRPLADQTELAFIRYLQTDPIVSLNEIKSIVNTNNRDCSQSVMNILTNFWNHIAIPSLGWKIHGNFAFKRLSLSARQIFG